MDTHDNCLQVPEFVRYTAQQADYQKAQNGSIQHIEARTDQIFDTLREMLQAQSDIYKTITEINAATLKTVQRVADKRGDDFQEHEAQRAADITAENKRFAGIEKSIGRMEQRAIWSNYMKRVPGKVWAGLIAAAAIAASIITILHYAHVF